MPALSWGGLPVAAYLERCDVLTTPDGVTLRYLALDDLVAMRLAVGRPKDLRRTAELRRLRPADHGPGDPEALAGTDPGPTRVRP